MYKGSRQPKQLSPVPARSLPAQGARVGVLEFAAVFHNKVLGGVSGHQILIESGRVNIFCKWFSSEQLSSRLPAGTAFSGMAHPECIANPRSSRLIYHFAFGHAR